MCEHTCAIREYSALAELIKDKAWTWNTAHNALGIDPKSGNVPQELKDEVLKLMMEKSGLDKEYKREPKNLIYERNTMTELNPKIKEALIGIDFIKRYEEVSKKFNAERTSLNHRLLYVDGKEVMEIIQELGFFPLFDSKEKFYKIREEQIGEFSFGVHIILQDGMVDLVWIVKEDGELLLGAPWGTYSRRLVDGSYRIKKPIFGTYEDLEQILKIAFNMYEDFKAVICRATTTNLRR